MQSAGARGLIDQVEHLFSGTATACDGGVCAMDHMLIFGFRVCDETTNSPHVQLEDLVEICLVNGCKLLPKARRGLSECIDPPTALSALVHQAYP